MRNLVLFLVLAVTANAVWAETYEDEVIDSFADGTGYFRYTVKSSDISALTWLPSFGVYEALGPENWNASIGSDFTSFTTDDPSSWTQPGDVFELYSTSTEVGLYIIWCRQQLSGSVRPWTWREVIVLGPALELPPIEQIEEVMEELTDIVNSNPSTPLADKVEDALDKTQTALEELNKTPPDNQAAVGNIEGAVGDLEEAVVDGLLDVEQGTQLMECLASIARKLATDAMNQAIDSGGDPEKINEAQDYLNEGDSLRASGSYKEAVAKYKDALSKAESAL